jgi:transcriptional regulator with XRE-family HTH domain
MIEVLTQLRVLWSLSGKTQQTIANNTGLSKSTVSNVLGGKTDDVRLQTIVDIAAEFGADVALITEQSKKAIDMQDVSYYRDQLAERDVRIEKQEKVIDALRAAADRLRKETDDDIIFYRDQIALLRDQLQRKDRYIDILIETASKGGDLKAVDLKKSGADL